ncbi:hypothetical protein [Streptomyces xiamenensis]|uniref:hypothetical protein n=1 Tax=Streptomyces xiamenensis TaxID=408015 RepID=UPI0035D8865A
MARPRTFSAPTTGFIAEIKIGGDLVNREGRVTIAGTYEEMRKLAIAFLHKRWPSTADGEIQKFVWKP